MLSLGMDLGYGTEYDGYRAQVRAFLQAHWPPAEAGGQPPTKEQTVGFRREAVAAGYLYRNIPRRYGGSEQQPDTLAAQIIREEFRRVRAPTELTGHGPQMVAPTLLEWGSDWQKDHFIRKAIEGEHIWCQGYSEPGAGSDLASLRTTGELRDGEWVLNGQKIWTPHWRRAHYMFALVRTAPPGEGVDAGRRADDPEQLAARDGEPEEDRLGQQRQQLQRAAHGGRGRGLWSRVHDGVRGID